MEIKILAHHLPCKWRWKNRAAERQRRATVTKADGQRQAAIAETDGRLEASRRDAEAQVVLARGSEQSIRLISEAVGEREIRCYIY